MIRSDLHIHSEHSHDSSLPVEEILRAAKAQGLEQVGVTDHVNFNDTTFLSNLRASAQHVKELQGMHPELMLGVELTPIEKPEFDHIAKTGTREGYQPPRLDRPYDIELAVSKEEMIALGLRYAIGATHWRVDVPHAAGLTPDLEADTREWYRQQMFLATDERVTVLGHPWYHGYGIWYEDFSLIPRSMNLDIAAALKENGKYVECNSHFFITQKASERFRRQYAEFLRELFEMGIPVTYGSDAHNHYPDERPRIEPYLAMAGFVPGDIGAIAQKDLW